MKTSVLLFVLIVILVSHIGPATIVLHKENPSDMHELDASVEFPVMVEY